MGTKIGSAVAPQQHGDELDKQRSIEEKYAWEQDRGWRNNPTCDVLRYTVAGEDAAAGITGTETLVPNLSGLRCSVVTEIKEISQKYGDVAMEGDRQFVLYDVQVVSTDLIEYDGQIYSPVGGSIWYNAASGRCEVLARIHGDD